MVRQTLSLDTYDGWSGGLMETVRECCRVASRAAARHCTADDVHEVRQALKRARAVLRLMEDAGFARAKPLRREMARVTRRFSASRDAAVAAKIAGNLIEELNGWERVILIELASEITPPAQTAWWSARCSELALIDRRLARLRPGRIPLDLEASLRRSLRRVRKQAKRARADRAIEVAHEWRKRVIVLREQVQVVRPLLGPEADELHQGLKQLAKRLGAATDYRVFLAAVKKRRGSGPLRAASARLVALVEKRQKRAMKRARKCWRKVKRLAAVGRAGHVWLASA